MIKSKMAQSINVKDKFALHLSTNLSTVALQKDWIMPAIERSSDPKLPRTIEVDRPGFGRASECNLAQGQKKNMKVIILAIIIV